MSTQLENVNRALIKAGISQLLVAMNEDSPEAGIASALYDQKLREALRGLMPRFAQKYADASMATTGGAMELFKGTATVPAIARADGAVEWQYAYRYPLDCAKALRCIGPNGRKFDRDPPPFVVGRNSPQADEDPDDDIVLIYSNEADAMLEYTAVVDLELDTTDPLFENAFQTLLASEFALSLSRDPDLARKLYLIFKDTVIVASTAQAQEQQQEKPQDGADWLDAR
jgi:hypothetical protein